MKVFENTPGWSWLISPEENGPMEQHPSCHAAGGVVAVVSPDINGIITIHLAHGKSYEHNAVAFDTEGRRHLLSETLSASSGSGGSSAAMRLFGGHHDTNAPPYNQVAHWGIEVIENCNR